ncbi:MAG: hypothetical protein RBT75_05480 [Anaerolineae bacterium]|jgi:beta-lactamase superfamily II metal-dependent hydrolase|nr:hypothetical protein [Anaerolineae bacterium]
MTNSQSIPPAEDELEVSIFGPGYGESILLHVGAGNWIVVDSCLDPTSRHPAALQYLSGINVDVAQAVKLVVATHWHDDHIRGLSTVFEACVSADFVLSNALRHEEFLTLIHLYQQPTVAQSSGVDEFVRILKPHLAYKSNNLKWAIADRLLFSNEGSINSETTKIKVYSLSPSDTAILQAKLAFTELLTEQTQQRKRISSLQPNDTAVVLWIEAGEHRILLGADLEDTPGPSTGWTAIISDSLVTTTKAQVFKIPHHGSVNAHNQDVWRGLLLDVPFALITPFNRGRKTLPSVEDTKRIAHLTPNAYITSPTKQHNLKFRERIVRESVDKVAKHIYKSISGWGQVRLRRKIEDPNACWGVELFGDACSLDSIS